MRNFIFLFLMPYFLGFAEILPIHSFQEAEDDLQNADPFCLVLFDVDEVLVSPIDVVLKSVGGNFRPASWNQLTVEQYEELLSIMLKSTEYVLVDSMAPKWIGDLRNRGVPTIGLTSCWTGSLGVIESMETWRIDRLNRVGIDFTSPLAPECAFPELVDLKEHPPLYKQGILFCGDFYSSKMSTKGTLLGIFLDRFKLTPSKILFFDDELKNLIAVQEELQKRNIPFKGFHFQTDPLVLDEKIAEIQFQTVLEHKKWVSDQEAKKLLKAP